MTWFQKECVSGWTLGNSLRPITLKETVRLIQNADAHCRYQLQKRRGSRKSGRPEGATKKISDDWVIQGWPTVVVLDTEMKIRYRGHEGDAAIKVVRELLTSPVK